MVRESSSHMSRERNIKNKTKEGKTWGKHCVEKESRRWGKRRQDRTVTGGADPGPCGTPS